MLVCSLFPGIFGLLAVVVRQLPGWPIWFAVLWAAQEWLKSTVPFGGFPWGVVAAGQTDGPFLPLVRLGSVPLLSLAIVLVGCSATAIALEIVSWWRASRRQRHTGADQRGQTAEVADSPPAVVLPAICICLVFFATAAIWPQVRHSGTGSGNEPIVTAAVVQGNVPRLGLEFNAQRLAVLDNDVRETRQLADDVHAGRAPQPDFVVWPEDASDVDPLRNPDAAQQISAAVETIGAPILVGTVLDVAGRPPDVPGGNEHGDRLESEDGTRRPPRQADRAAVRGIPALARLLSASVRARRLGGLHRPGQRHRRGACRGYSGRGRDLLGSDFRPCAARLGPQRRPGARGARQQRQLQPDHERAAAGLLQGPRRGTRPLRRRRQQRGNLRAGHARRPRAGPDEVLRAGLPGQPGAPAKQR